MLCLFWSNESVVYILQVANFGCFTLIETRFLSSLSERFSTLTIPGLASAATAACRALPDADMLTATNDRILSHRYSLAARGAGLYAMAMHDWPQVPRLGRR